MGTKKKKKKKKKKKNWRILHREAGAIWVLKKKKRKEKIPLVLGLEREREREREREVSIRTPKSSQEIAGTCEPCDLESMAKELGGSSIVVRMEEAITASQY